MSQFTLRPTTSADVEFLWQMLAEAAYEPDVQAAKSLEILTKYLSGWQRPTDFGFIAEEAGRPLGAAWARQFTLDEKPFTYVDDRTPEFAIGVLPGQRGHGIGTALLTALLDQARKDGRAGLVLVGRHDNPALRLYERLGFTRIPGAERPNRVGGFSIGMVKRF